MKFDVVQGKLYKAIDQILGRDSYLLLHDINERSIAHRLAMYLTPKFKGFDVDCEYNGNVESPNGKKYINILKDTARSLGLLKEGLQDKELVCRYVYPDIIVHKRGKSGSVNNLLIIEMKKSSSNISRDLDYEKLKRFTSHDDGNNFDYQFGAFILVQVGEEQKMEVSWYREGKCLDLDSHIVEGGKTASQCLALSAR